MVEISLSSDEPHFSQEHQIFGRMYVLEFEWIEREQYWVMHLCDGDEQPIALGLRVSPGWPMIHEQESNIVLMLVAKHSQIPLTLSTLHKDFTLVAYAPV